MTITGEIYQVTKNGEQNNEGFEGFSLLNPMKVINGEAQANETPTGLNLSEYNTFIIGETAERPVTLAVLIMIKE